MRGLPTLIRLARHELDERRRRLGELQGQQDKLRMDAALVEARLEAERLNAQEAGQVAFAFGSYMNVALAHRDRLLEQAEAMNPEIAAALDVVRTAFEEVKRLELVEEAERREARRKEEAAERLALDEVGLQRHLRRGRDGEGDGQGG